MKNSRFPVGQSLHPYFKGVTTLTVLYYANERPWIIREIFLVGFTLILY